MAVQDQPVKSNRRYRLLCRVAGGIVGAFLGLAFVIVALFALMISVVGVYSEGSPELAAQWKTEMSSWDSPADALDDATVQVFEFPHDEWAIVRAKSCHGGLWNGGGTMVVKDSSGQLQAFHRGHVCGDGNPLIADEYDDLASFYKALKDADFRDFEVD